MLETELFALLEQTADAAYTVTESGEICSWNGAAERLFGWSREEVLGQSLVGVLHAASEAPAIPDVREAASSNGWDGETRLVRKDGTEFAAHARLAPIRDAGGRQLGIVCARRRIELLAGDLAVDRAGAASRAVAL